MARNFSPSLALREKQEVLRPNSLTHWHVHTDLLVCLCARRVLCPSKRCSVVLGCAFQTFELTVVVSAVHRHERTRKQATSGSCAVRLFDACNLQIPIFRANCRLRRCGSRGDQMSCEFFMSPSSTNVCSTGYTLQAVFVPARNFGNHQMYIFRRIGLAECLRIQERCDTNIGKQKKMDICWHLKTSRATDFKL